MNGLKNLLIVGLMIWLSYKLNGCLKLMLICYFWCNISICISIIFRKGKICLKLYIFLINVICLMFVIVIMVSEFEF